MNHSAPIPLSDYQALAEFRYQLRLFLRFSEDAARAVGLEPQHHQLMLAIKGMPEERAARIADVAERLQLQHHSVVELVGRLETRGLVRRSRREEDRREVQVSLTRRGEDLLGELTGQMQQELRSAAPALVTSLQKVMRRPGTRERRSRGHEPGNGRASTTRT